MVFAVRRRALPCGRDFAVRQGTFAVLPSFAVRHESLPCAFVLCRVLAHGKGSLLASFPPSDPMLVLLSTCE
jgi:hypothetical protein